MLVCWQIILLIVTIMSQQSIRASYGVRLVNHKFWSSALLATSRDHGGCLRRLLSSFWTSNFFIEALDLQVLKGKKFGANPGRILFLIWSNFRAIGMHKSFKSNWKILRSIILNFNMDLSNPSAVVLAMWPWLDVDERPGGFLVWFDLQ